MDNLPSKQSDFIFYQSSEGKIRIQVIIDDEHETIWATQKSMAEIFDVNVPAVSKHLSNIFEQGELVEDSVVSILETTATDGKNYKTKFYNLDAIISVGYRVNSFKATQFRVWASSILKEYLIKGFALDDDRLKQGKALFKKDYFDELLEKIREIRASERNFYRKITDIYTEASIDYDKNSQITKDFFVTVQNKLHWAIHQHTAAELISERANSRKPKMGLTSFKNSNTTGKVLKSDTEIAKNYLTKEELGDLNRLVSMYLDFAENMAKRRKEMKMKDWVVRLDAFLQFNEYEILEDLGKVSKVVAKKTAHAEYEKFRTIQDREYESDFDKVVIEIKDTGKLPTPPHERFSIQKPKEEKPLSDFNQKLKKGLEFNPKDRPVSALSISSIKKRKEHKDKKYDKE
ncbi:virulence RhuM family protein [Kordia jejudonensis]|nr:virulence RhuM family protein [Kordia jejudonensis]